MQIRKSGGALPSAEIGVPYSFNLAEKVRIDGESSPDYGSVSWSAITPLPPGIQLSEHGLISGTPIIAY